MVRSKNRPQAKFPFSERGAESSGLFFFLFLHAIPIARAWREEEWNGRKYFFLSFSTSPVKNERDFLFACGVNKREGKIFLPSPLSPLPPTMNRQSTMSWVEKMKRVFFFPFLLSFAQKRMPAYLGRLSFSFLFPPLLLFTLFFVRPRQAGGEEKSFVENSSPLLSFFSSRKNRLTRRGRRRLREEFPFSFFLPFTPPPPSSALGRGPKDELFSFFLFPLLLSFYYTPFRSKRFS